MDKKFQIIFKGSKKEIHEQLKAHCEEAGRTINGLVIELIQKYLHQYEKQNNKLKRNGQNN
jgi:predicted transcriptional regulator